MPRGGPGPRGTPGKPAYLSSHGRSSAKRLRKSDLDDGDEAIETGDGRQRRRFACPFWKFNPIRYADCLERQLFNPSAVVQHLHRAHGIQVHCPICGCMFQSPDERDAHIVRQSCDFREFRREGVTEDQHMAIKGLRERSDWRLLPQDSRWYLIYEALFPNARRVDSPYVDSPLVEVAAVSEIYFIEQLPVLFSLPSPPG